MKYKAIQPRPQGWLECQLNDKEVSHIWDCINTARQGSLKHALVGQVEKSFEFHDKGNWFFNSVLNDLIKIYGDRYGHEHCRIPTVQQENLRPFLKNIWVNYQNAGEFNPIHDHGGVYSFAAWLRNPVEYDDQALLPNAKDASSSLNNTFTFNYTDLFGSIQTYVYKLGKENENILLFFPAILKHAVYPFYECDTQRISISGNIWLRDPQ